MLTNRQVANIGKAFAENTSTDIKLSKTQLSKMIQSRGFLEQATFTYSPLGKVFEKQTKTIEDQGKKQVKAIQDNKHLVNINKGDDYKDKLLLSKEREIFKDIYNKRLDKIEELNNKIEYDNLQYVAVNSGKIYNFSELTDLLTFLNEIKKGKMSLGEAKNYQQNYLNYLNIIRKGNKNANQKNTLPNINIHFNASKNATKFIEDYGSMILEAKKLAKEQEGAGLKILTPNQMLKRLPIGLAQIKAMNIVN